MNQIRTESPLKLIADRQIVNNLLYGVVIALIPSFAVSLWYFGLGALILTLASVALVLTFEYVVSKYLLKKEAFMLDGAAILTGVLLAFSLPSNLPLWILVIGAALAVGVAKIPLGKLGNPVFNSVLVSRVVLFFLFPVQMNSWPLPLVSRLQYLDAATGATPLTLLNEGLKTGEPVAQILGSANISYLNMFLGETGGSLGEVSAVALLIGLAYLLIKKIVTWHIPVSIAGSFVAVTGGMWYLNPNAIANPLFYLLTGGFLLGTVFMATDYFTSPKSPIGMLIFGSGIGVLAAVFCIFGVYSVGMAFAILLMNAAVPLINKYIKAENEEIEIQPNTLQS
ncbi:MAG TPA: Na+-transporting NADH:ubiquinone oxidoreductase subunit D [Bacteroidales bacterium]|nr:Na+-transporting NADH:ubiquinone oxidoreductase subunit D [Bacteroidales bacterium]